LCETEIQQYQASTKTIGLDLGIRLILSPTGEVVEKSNSTERNCVKPAKKLSRSQKILKVKAKAKLAVSTNIITNLRDDFLYQPKLIEKMGLSALRICR